MCIRLIFYTKELWYAGIKCYNSFLEKVLANEQSFEQYLKTFLVFEEN